MAFAFTSLGTLPSYPNVEVNQGALSNDGNTVAVCWGSSPYIRVWKYNGSGFTLQTVNTPPTSAIIGCQVSPDGSVIYGSVSGGTAVKRWVWNAATSQYDAASDIAVAGGGIARGLSLSPDGNLLAIGCNTVFRVAKFSGGSWSVVLNSGAVYTQTMELEWGADSRTCVLTTNVAGAYAYVFYWNDATNTFTQVYGFGNGGERIGAISKDGKYILCGRQTQGSGLVLAKMSGSGASQTGTTLSDATTGAQWAVSLVAGAWIGGGSAFIVAQYGTAVAPKVFRKDSGSNDHFTEETISGYNTLATTWFATNYAQDRLLQMPTSGTVAHVYAVPSKNEATGALKGLLPKVAGTLKAFGVKGALRGLLPKAAGTVTMPIGATGALKGLLPKTDGLVAAIDDDPIKFTVDLFSQPATIVVAARPVALASELPPLFVYANLRGLLPRTAGEVDVPFGGEGKLRGLLPKVAGSAKFRYFLEGEWAGRLPKIAATAQLAEGQIAGKLVGLLPRVAGEGTVPFGLRADLRGLLPRVAASAIFHYKATGELHGRLPRTSGLVEVPFVINGDLRGLLPRFNAWGAPDYQGEGHFVGLLPRMSGLAERDPPREVSGELKGLLPKTDGYVAVPFVASAALRGLKPRVAGNLKNFGARGELKGLLPKMAGQIERAYRVDANLRGRLPRMAGFVTPKPKFSGELRGLLPRSAGDLKLTYKVESELTGLLPRADGTFKIYYGVRAPLKGLLPSISGEIKTRYLADGELTGLLPRADGDLTIRYLINGELRGLLPRFNGSTIPPRPNTAEPTFFTNGGAFTVGGPLFINNGDWIRVG